MKRLILLVICTVFLVSSSAVATSRLADKLTDEEKLEKGWIVQYVSGDPLVTLEVQAVIAASVEDVWKLFTDVGAWKKWMTMMSTGKGILPGEVGKKDEATYQEAMNTPEVPISVSDSGKTTAVIFEEYDFPWPINNDWEIREYKFDASGREQGIYKVSFRPLFEGVEPERGGNYILKKHNNSDAETYLEYKITVPRRESIPRGVFDVVLGQTADRLVRAIRKNTEKS